MEKKSKWICQSVAHNKELSKETTITEWEFFSSKPLPNRSQVFFQSALYTIYGLVLIDNNPKEQTSKRSLRKPLQIECIFVKIKFEKTKDPHELNKRSNKLPYFHSIGH